jgi:hypothetical protein
MSAFEGLPERTFNVTLTTRQAAYVAIAFSCLPLHEMSETERLEVRDASNAFIAALDNAA